MKTAKMWRFVQAALRENMPVVLLVVAESRGSSPGRAGFKMALRESGENAGTIGGGNVEFQLLNRAAFMLKEKITSPEIARRVHEANGASESSGMICSGEQSVLLCPLFRSHLAVVDDIILAETQNSSLLLEIGADQISLKPVIGSAAKYLFQTNDENHWIYRENIGRKHPLFIFGAGHVCLELCTVLQKLDFYVTIVDDRPELELMRVNEFADEKIVSDYGEAAKIIPPDSENYYVIMTHSHSADAVVLKQLITRSFKYLGMMGSPRKVAEIYRLLEEQGVNPELFKKVNSPIGVPIKSKTAGEIAISIAAELVQVKNTN